MTALPNPAKALRFEVVLDKTQPTQVCWLEYGMIALRAIEQHFGVTAEDLRERMEKGGFTDELAIFHAGLIKHHPNVTDIVAASIMDELGHGEATELMKRAFLRSMPDENTGAGQADPDPQTAQPNRKTRRRAAAQSKSS